MATVNPPFLDRTSIEPQELFDFAVRALHAMPRQAKAKNRPGCLYRTGMADCPACIAGQMMTDDELVITLEMQKRDYAEATGSAEPYFALEGVACFDDADIPGFDTMATLGVVPARLAPHKDLIQDLQDLHDTGTNWIGGRRHMAAQLCTIAATRGLSPAVVDELWPEAWS